METTRSSLLWTSAICTQDSLAVECSLGRPSNALGSLFYKRYRTLPSLLSIPLLIIHINRHFTDMEHRQCFATTSNKLFRLGVYVLGLSSTAFRMKMRAVNLAYDNLLGCVLNSVYQYFYGPPHIGFRWSSTHESSM